MSNETNMPDSFPFLVRQILPTASDETVAYIQSHYNYPTDNPAKLAWDWSTDVIFGCPAANIAAAYAKNDNRAMRYLFTAPPGTHGQDATCESGASIHTSPFGYSFYYCDLSSWLILPFIFFLLFNPCSVSLRAIYCDDAVLLFLLFLHPVRCGFIRLLFIFGSCRICRARQKPIY